MERRSVFERACLLKSWRDSVFSLRKLFGHLLLGGEINLKSKTICIGKPNSPLPFCNLHNQAYVAGRRVKLR